MKVGIAYSNDDNSFASGQTVAENALINANIERPDLVLAICGGELDYEEFF